MPLHTYTELDLVPTAVPSSHAPALVRDWLGAGSPAELKRRIRAALDALPFEWMSHGILPHAAGPLLFSSHSNPSWTRICHDEITRLAAPSPSTLPFTRVDGGVLVSLKGRHHSREQAVVAFGSRRPGHEWIPDPLLSDAYLFALCVHELLTVHMGLRGMPDPPVSPIRREILRHLSGGHSNKQIAYRLRLSADTVKYHMRELRRHFNARNRMQLADKAGSMSLGA